MQIIALVVSLALFSAASFCQQPLKGTVTDSEGAAIFNAMVLIHSDPLGSRVGLSSNAGLKTDIVLHTDAHGRFEAALTSGFYDVFVSATAFSPACRKIRVKVTPPQDLRFRMEAAPLVMKEIGDTLPSAPRSH